MADISTAVRVENWEVQCPYCSFMGGSILFELVTFMNHVVTSTEDVEPTYAKYKCPECGHCFTYHIESGKTRKLIKDWGR